MLPLIMVRVNHFLWPAEWDGKKSEKPVASEAAGVYTISFHGRGGKALFSLKSELDY
jgi:hypothetical protein